MYSSKSENPPEEDPFFAEVYAYDTLSAAYATIWDSLSEDCLDKTEEEVIINLQNHLLWGSYEPGEDPDMDSITLAAIDILSKRQGISLFDAPGRSAAIVSELLTV